MRLIDADALILALETQDYSGAPDTLEDWTPQDMTKAEIADINNAPTIDAVPVRHGKWIEQEVITDNKAIEEWQSTKCSKCGKYHTTPYMYYFDHYHYCPHCGALMDLKEEDE